MAEKIHLGHRKRMFESFLRAGDLKGFSDIQIIEFILFFAIPRRDTNVMAHNIINKFGSAEKIFKLSPYEIMKKMNYTLKTSCILTLLPKVYEICSYFEARTKDDITKNFFDNEDYLLLLEKYAETESFECFTEREILRIFLYYSVSKNKIDELMEILFQKFSSINDLFRLPPVEIFNISSKFSMGMACLFGLPMQISERFEITGNVKNISDKVVINSINEAVNYLSPLFNEVTDNCFYFMYLDNNKMLINTVCLKKSELFTENQNIDMKKILSSAMRVNAVYIIISNNDVSDNIVLSSNIVKFTLQITAAFKTVGIKLMDYIIMGNNSYYSIAQKNLFGCKKY